MRASFWWHIDADKWIVQVGWVGDDQSMGVEFDLGEWAESGESIAEVTQRTVNLARTLVLMKREGATLDDMDAMLSAIAADGGL